MNFDSEDELSPSDITTGSVRKKNTILQNTSEIIRLLITILLTRSGSSLHFQLPFSFRTLGTPLPWQIAKSHHGISLGKPVNAILTMEETSSRSSDDFLSLSNEITIL